MEGEGEVERQGVPNAVRVNLIGARPTRPAQHERLLGDVAGLEPHGRHGVAAQIKFESKNLKAVHHISVQALSSRRFQHGFDRVKLHRPTMAPYTPASTTTAVPWMQGLTLVHFSAQCERFLWYRGCIEGLLRRCLVDV